MASNKLETRRKKDSYEVRRNDEIVLYFRKDVFPRWCIRLVWTAVGIAITKLTPLLIAHL